MFELGIKKETITKPSLYRNELAVPALLSPAGIELTLEVQRSLDPKATLKEFIQALSKEEKFQQRVADIRAEVEAFAGQFPMPGLPEL